MNHHLAVLTLLLVLISFVVWEASAICNNTITGLTLIDTDLNVEIGPLPKTLDYASLPTTHLNIRADYTSCPEAPIGSVYEQYRSSKLRRQFCERQAPFAIFGDNNTLDSPPSFDPFTFPVEPRQTIQVTPYTTSFCNGSKGLAKKATLNVQNSAPCPGKILSLVLWDAPSAKPEIQLVQGAKICPKTTNFTIQARALDCQNSTIGSVKLELTDQSGGIHLVRLEKRDQYFLFGNQDAFIQGGGRLQPGTYTMTATPFATKGGNGAKGQPLRLTFVVESPTTVCPPSPPPTSLTLLRKLVGPNTLTPSFGSAVAMADGMAMVGAEAAVYIYKIDSLGQFFLDQVLAGIQGWVRDISISGDVVAVSDLGIFDDPGSVIIYRKSTNGTYVMEQVLFADDPYSHDGFGNSAALSSNTLVVGCFFCYEPGRGNIGTVYLFEYKCVGGGSTDCKWLRQTKLYNKIDHPRPSLLPVALQDNTLAVGWDRTSSPNQHVDVYKRDSSGMWQYAQQIATPTLDQLFGYELALHQDTLVVGATTLSNVNGSAYVYERSSAMGNWSLEAELKGNATDREAFGYPIAVHGDTIVVAPVFSSPNFAGAAYVFTRNSSTGDWSRLARVTDTGFSAKYFYFGDAVAVHRGLIAVGHNLYAEYNGGSVSFYTCDDCSLAIKLL